MATKKKAGGVAAPAGLANISKTTFNRNFAPTWREAQREHAARASALCARGAELRRILRARARS